MLTAFSLSSSTLPTVQSSVLLLALCSKNAHLCLSVGTCKFALTAQLSGKYLEVYTCAGVPSEIQLCILSTILLKNNKRQHISQPLYGPDINDVDDNYDYDYDDVVDYLEGDDDDHDDHDDDYDGDSDVCIPSKFL